MGRLIDADKAIEDIQYYHDDCAKTSEYTRLGFETAIEVVKDAPTVEAIPKAEVRKLLKDNAEKVSDSILDIVKEEYISKSQYENRLKADMVAMLEDLDLQIDESAAYNLEVAKVQRLIRDKINALRGEKDETGKSNK